MGSINLPIKMIAVKSGFQNFFRYKGGGRKLKNLNS